MLGSLSVFVAYVHYGELKKGGRNDNQAYCAEVTAALAREFVTESAPSSWPAA